MASRLGSGYYTAIVVEDTYGTAVTELTTATYFWEHATEIKNEPILTDTKAKTGTTAPKIEEKVITGTGGTVTIRGNLSSDHEILLTALTHDTATPFVFQEASTAVKSYTIYQLFEAGTTPSGTAYNIATGCVLTNLTISGEANGIVQFEATFRANAVDRAITTALSAGPASWLGDDDQFLLANVTATLANTKTTMNSFSLNFEKTLADDRISYQNSLTRTAEYLIAFNGTVDFETIYDDAVDLTYDGNIGVQTAVENLITLVEGAKSWAITTFCRIASFTQADPDKGLFVAQYSLELAGTDSTDVALSVAVV